MSESFAELFEESLKTIDMQPGSIVTGVVIDIDSDWAKQDGWEISGGTANFDFNNIIGTSNRNLFQTIFEVDKNYVVSFDVINYVQGAVRIVANGQDGIEYNANGSYEVYFKAKREKDPSSAGIVIGKGYRFSK